MCYLTRLSQGFGSFFCDLSCDSFWAYFSIIPIWGQLLMRTKSDVSWRDYSVDRGINGLLGKLDTNSTLIAEWLTEYKLNSYLGNITRNKWSLKKIWANPMRCTCKRLSDSHACFCSNCHWNFQFGKQFDIQRTKPWSKHPIYSWKQNREVKTKHNSRF